jgi:hypothetical protein
LREKGLALIATVNIPASMVLKISVNLCLVSVFAFAFVLLSF